MRTRVVCGLVAGVLLLFAAATTSANEEAEKRELIVELLEATRMLDNMDRVRDLLLRQSEAKIRAADPEVDERALEIVKQVVSEEYATLTQEALAWSADFMSRHYTEAEVRELIAFYRTDLGQKTVDLMPQLSMEMSTILQRQITGLPARIQTRIEERLQARGETL